MGVTLKELREQVQADKRLAIEVIQKADQGDESARAKQCNTRRPLNATCCRNERKRDQKTHDDGGPAAARRRHRVRASRIGDVHQASRQGVPAKYVRKKQRCTRNARYQQPPTHI